MTNITSTATPTISISDAPKADVPTDLEKEVKRLKKELRNALKTKQEYLDSYNQTTRVNNQLRKKNGHLFCVIEKVAPQLIVEGTGDVRDPSEDLSVKPVKTTKVPTALPSNVTFVDGVKMRSGTCIVCTEEWTESSRRGRMNKKCPTCRELPED